MFPVPFPLESRMQPCQTVYYDNRSCCGLRWIHNHGCRELGAVMCCAFTYYLFVFLDLNDDRCTFFSYLSFRVQGAFSTTLKWVIILIIALLKVTKQRVHLILFIVFMNLNEF